MVGVKAPNVKAFRSPDVDCSRPLRDMLPRVRRKRRLLSHAVLALLLVVNAILLAKLLWQ
jgi:hypothetical protein